MALMQLGRLLPFFVVLILALELAGCASGPLGSHGVDNIPAFDTGPQGVGR